MAWLKMNEQDWKPDELDKEINNIINECENCIEQTQDIIEIRRLEKTRNLKLRGLLAKVIVDGIGSAWKDTLDTVGGEEHVSREHEQTNSGT